jgi:hypothetical protein
MLEDITVKYDALTIETLVTLAQSLTSFWVGVVWSQKTQFTPKKIGAVTGTSLIRGISTLVSKTSSLSIGKAMISAKMRVFQSRAKTINNKLNKKHRLKLHFDLRVQLLSVVCWV